MISLAKRDMMELPYQLAEVNGLIHISNNENRAAGTHWYRDVMKKRFPEVSIRQAEATHAG